MINPAGAATVTALPRTKESAIKNRTNDHFADLRTPIRGELEGKKEEGTPFKNVLDKIRETSKVITTPRTITAINQTAETIDRRDEITFPAKNMVIIAIRVGKRPLQGTKLLVMVAIKRSRGESIIRQPTTPQALQPNPIAIVNACLPCAHAFLKYLSMLKAIRGR